jgi:hypothetical protein
MKIPEVYSCYFFDRRTSLNQHLIPGGIFPARPLSLLSLLHQSAHNII